MVPYGEVPDVSLVGGVHLRQRCPAGGKSIHVGGKIRIRIYKDNMWSKMAFFGEKWISIIANCFPKIGFIFE